MAIEKVNTDIVKLLLKNDKIDVNIKCNNDTPLILAAARGSTEIVELLLSQPNIDINCKAILIQKFS